MNDGFGSTESVVPFPSKSQANRIESPGSGSFEPSLEKATVSVAVPDAVQACSIEAMRSGEACEACQ